MKPDLEALRALAFAGEGEPDELGGDIVTLSLRNPDGPELFAALETLAAERDRLVALVEKQLRQKASAAWDAEAKRLLASIGERG